MDVKASSFVLLVCVSTFIIIILHTEGAVGIPSCCVTVSKRISRDILCATTRYDIQSRAGVCEIPALILHVGSRRVCVQPKLRRILKKLQKSCRRVTRSTGF